MKTVKGFNKVQSKNKIFGLEFLDLLVLLLIYLIVFVLSNNLLVNLAIVFTAYFFLKFYKKGKSPHWAGSVIRFLVRPKKYQPKRELEQEIFQ
ncbi:MAG: hypothetical protein A3G33_08285 [Omnitrophica bacterium RIFCSPLOWO2_12_FULL_44_17]|uniref:Type IV conjugative transfer system protein TraL n=1 Tax=Candidatus Danuiimicrobium aquiferis TaxID=1801832 RepID=A0A1G1KWK8_9BACT|nr:MAG: hypothetical protein A3B72_03500 [Omnitrophica bacterium RIFCSPHIGHO2_02_FULL_45_28]OGW90522.1 MAG: hypothetical protein A3E74_03025 [Omnitrophica bacterium RIFCSPHIGHO2_12_FULL_44_12]OGW97162.1 MAG: hypothetical protein A3G33_08285 [Omnitrophica bacterium RIFCSPLOWO2_12_FULL_44_17]OGX02222.1 MAG: hypothetical protein A3J12_08070 [Omnitrophica bacterium RIFCSPLOWO2_02_FULL_44_11]